MLKTLRPLFPIPIFLLLLTTPSLVRSGASYGLLLWFQVILPTLLPFLLCSGLLTAWGAIPHLVKPFRPVCSLLHLSPEGSYCLLTGLLCGCPMGAKTTVDFLGQNKISSREGKWLLVLSGCPSPMFLTGYIKTRLPGTIPFSAIVLSLYLPLLFIGFFSRTNRDRVIHPSAPNWETASLSEPAFDRIVMNSIEIIVKIGIYMMIYSIITAYIEALPESCIPQLPKCILLSLTEITTGIDYISTHIKGNLSVFFILFSSAFGGFSCASQIHAVIQSSENNKDASREKNAGLSIRHYVLWKLIHASLSCATLILLLLLQQLRLLLLPL